MTENYRRYCNCEAFIAILLMTGVMAIRNEKILEAFRRTKMNRRKIKSENLNQIRL